MPAYNTDKFIGDSIGSVLNQTFNDFELIIINDGSTDNTKKVVESFDDTRIKYFENKNNSGIVYSRNRGLDLVQGDFVAMLDADDIAHPEKFQLQIDFLKQNKEFGMIGSWAKFIDPNGRSIPGKWKLNASPEMIPAIMLFKNYFLQSAVVYTKDCIKNYRFKEGFDILEDYLIWLDIIKNYKTWNLPKYLVDYRIHPEGVTKKHKEEKFEKEKEVYRIQLRELGIQPSQQELELHSIIRNNEPNNEIEILNQIEKWLLKIINSNNQTKVFNQKMLASIVFNRWLKVCNKSSSLHLKMLYKLVNSPILISYLKSYNPLKNNI